MFFIQSLEIKVKDKDYIGTNSVGRVDISTDKLLSEETFDGILQLVTYNNLDSSNFIIARYKLHFSTFSLFLFTDWFDLTRDGKQQGRIHLAIKFTAKINTNETDANVRDAYFPLRKNNRFILYQDAETLQMPQVISYKSIAFK